MNNTHKLKESTIIDENEAEKENEVLNPSDSEYEVATIPDTQVVMTPQFLDSISSSYLKYTKSTTQ